MAHTLADRLATLKAEALQGVDPIPAKILTLVEEVLALVEQNRGDLTEAYEAQIQMTQRIDALEKRLPPYEGARG